MRTYYRLIKPGIVYGNTLTGIAAFIFGSTNGIAWSTFLFFSIGLTLSMAGGCVFNNILDRDIDAHMERTRKRALVTGTVSTWHAFIFGSLLTLLGLSILLAGVSPLVFAITVIGVIFYVGLYTPTKRWTPQSTIIGAVAGAIPPVAGYAAAASTLDAQALVLFLILVTWQMTHFFAIALYRSKEYGAAGIPVMPLVIGSMRTRLLMILHTIAFSYAVVALYLLGNLHAPYLYVMTPVCAFWIFLSLMGIHTKNTDRWARRMFFTSLIALLVFSFAIVLLRVNA